MTLSSYAVILLNTSPIFVTILAHWWIPGERLTLKKWIGMLVAFCGVVLLFLPSMPSSGFFIGNLLALTAGFLLSVIHVMSKHLLRDIKPGQLVFWEFTYAVPIFFLTSLLFEPASKSMSLPIVGSILYQGIVVAGFCFVAWMHLLQHYPASKMASFQFSIPVFGVFLSWLILDEPLSGHLIFGVALVASGIFLVTSSEVKRTDMPLPEPSSPQQRIKWK
jgi:drug/metabolite transporter (DMT)-like permease